MFSYILGRIFVELNSPKASFTQRYSHRNQLTEKQLRYLERNGYKVESSVVVEDCNSCLEYKVTRK